MRNLIFANFTRLKKSKLFRAGIIVSSLYTVFLLIMNYLEMTASVEITTVMFMMHLQVKDAIRKLLIMIQRFK